MRTVALFVALLITGVSALVAQPAMPRKAPELTVAESNGKETLLSSFKGKVVVVAFMHTTCPHCQAEAQMLTKLQSEFGSRGFQPLGIAFNDNAAMLVNDFVRTYHVGFPVGYANRQTVESFLSLSVMDRYVVPQIAIMNRKGQIVAQSAPTGTLDLQDEKYLRNLIDGLLKEDAPSTHSSAKKPGSGL